MDSWVEFINDSDFQFSKTKTKFADSDNFFWKDFLTSLGRDVSIEDVQTGYRNKSVFQIEQSDRGSWCSKSGESMPKIAMSIEDFL